MAAVDDDGISLPGLGAEGGTSTVDVGGETVSASGLAGARVRLGRLRQNPTARIIFRLGPLWPRLLLGSICAGILDSSLPFIFVNYYARKYTNLPPSEIRCDVSFDQDYCRSAVPDATAISTFFVFVGSLTQVLASPIMGEISDTRGRRPVICVMQLLTLVPLFSLVAFVYFNASVYIVLVCTVFSSLSLDPVHYAWCIDRIEDRNDRTTAFGLMPACGAVSRLVGSIIGARLSLQAGFNVSVVLTVADTVYTQFFFCESLTPEKRREGGPCSLSQLWKPFKGLGILVRTRLMLQLTVIIIGATIVDSGFGTVAPAYVQKYIPGWNRQTSNISDILEQIGTFCWLAFGLGWLSAIFSETGTLAASRWGCLAYGMSFLWITKPWQEVLGGIR